MEEQEKIMCPSSKAQPGAQLLGVRQDDGTVAILPQPLRIDEAFLEAAGATAPAEQRFRFTNKCVESGCTQWTGSRCGVVDKVLSVMHELALQDELPDCAIRPQCRWFRQGGPDACKVCPYVVTHTTEADWDLQQLAHPLFPMTEEK